MGLTFKLLLRFMVILDVYRPFVWNKTTFIKNRLTPVDLWNPLNKAVPGKFHGSGGHSKCNSLQDRANFHRSRGWQIAPLFITALQCITITSFLVRCVLVYWVVWSREPWILNQRPPSESTLGNWSVTSSQGTGALNIEALRKNRRQMARPLGW